MQVYASFDLDGSGLVTQAEIGSLTAQVRFQPQI